MRSAIRLSSESLSCTSAAWASMRCARCWRDTSRCCRESYCLIRARSDDVTARRSVSELSGRSSTTTLPSRSSTSRLRAERRRAIARQQDDGEIGPRGLAFEPAEQRRGLLIRQGLFGDQRGACPVAQLRGQRVRIGAALALAPVVPEHLGNHVGIAAEWRQNQDAAFHGPVSLHGRSHLPRRRARRHCPCTRAARSAHLRSRARPRPLPRRRCRGGTGESSVHARSPGS